MTASRGHAGPTSDVQDATLPGTTDLGPPVAVNYPNRQPTPRAASVARLAMALALATVLGALPARPALADDHDDHEGHDRGYERGYEHGHEHRRWDEHQRYRIYAPPAVYYPREASPGISLFIPFEIR